MVYLHGQGGSRKQGVDDFTFGGNFNRVKNLMAENGGLYLSPDFSDFGDKGAAEIAALITHYAEQLARRARLRRLRLDGRGAGAGSLPADKTVAPRLSGLLLLGSLWDERFSRQPGFQAQGAGVFRPGQSRSPCSRSTNQEAFFRSISAKSPGYPDPLRPL